MPAKKKRLASPVVSALLAEMQRQGLTAYALAKKSGVSAVAIGRIASGERPDPQVSTLEKLAAGLGKSLEIR